MINETQLKDMITEAKAQDKERKFKQAIELIMVFQRY